MAQSKSERLNPLATSVFDRTDTGESPISPQIYNLMIGLVLLYGFGVNYIMVQTIDPQVIAGINQWVFFGGYFASCFAGIYLFNTSSNPLLSFVGYNLVVVPFGLIVNVVVHQYDPEVVQAAIRVTALVTMLMMPLGSIFPSFFEKIIGGLRLALLAVIVVEVVEIFIFGIHHGVIDWIVAGIFCGYIGYDWARANKIPYTLDNAVDSAAALYMDIINLFIRILRIMGRQKK